VRALIDADQHLFEDRTCWAERMPAAQRADALAIVDDEAGNAWLTWRGRRLGLADVPEPGDVAALGRRLQAAKRGEPPEAPYDERLPADYHDPAARLRRMDRLGVAEAVCFPNYGLIWEEALAADLPAQLANMAAWNRRAVEVAADGAGRLHPVGHVSLRDLGWLEEQLRALAAGGVCLAMCSPGLVDGRPLSHPDLDAAWSMFVYHGISPVFHVANFTKPFDPAWYADDPEPANPELFSIFLWVPPALAIADLAIHGVFERHPDLRLGVMELSAVWVPLFCMFLDGGHDFVSRLHGATITALPCRPSEYLRRQVRVAAFSYERPDRLSASVGDLFMACSDWPHSEGTASPAAELEALGPLPAGFRGGNVDWLLRRR
jgi:hypothetical protein